MPSPLLIAAAAAAGFFVLRRRGPTAADGPRLRELYLTKLYIVRDMKVCAQKVAHEEKRFTSADLLGVFAAMAAIAGGADFATTMKAARGAQAGGTLAGWGHKEVAQLCPGVRESVATKAARNDELSAQLGLDPNLTYQEVAVIAQQVGASIN